MAIVRRTTREPTHRNVTEFCESVLEMDVWPTDRPGWGDLFMHDTEWAWRRDLFRLEDA